MKLIMISKDNKILDKSSGVFSRMKDLSDIFDELHIFILGKEPKILEIKDTDKLFIYNTTSVFLPFSFLKVFFRVLRIGKRKKFDYITSQDPFETGLLALIISKIIHCKLQFQIHTDFLSPFFRKESLINKIRVFIAKKILNRADSLRVVSMKIRESVLDNFKTIKPQSVSVLPVFIDQDKITNSPKTFDLREMFPQFKKIILIVARLEKEKNIDLAIFAFELLLKQVPDAGLVICGEGSLKQNLIDLVDKLKIGASVKFLGWVNDIYSAYRSSDCLLVTSSYEGYGMNMVEANILGLPIVSTDVGVARELKACIIEKSIGSVEKGLMAGLGIKKEEYYNLILLNQNEYQVKFRTTFNI